MTELRDEKAQLRARLRAERRSKATRDVERQSQALMHRLALLESFLNVSNLAPRLAFWGVHNEVDTRHAIRERVTRGQSIYLPKIIQAPTQTHSGKMRFLAYEGDDCLVEGRMGLKEPRPTAAELQLASHSQIICWVPGLAFAKNGARLGQGGGFYDLYLSSSAPSSLIRIGLCFDDALVVPSAIPENSRDERVHWIVTPTRTMACPPSTH